MEYSEVKTVTDVIGEWGPWQNKLLIYFTLANIASGLNNFATVFYAPRIQYFCVDYIGKNLTGQFVDHCYKLDGEKCTQWEYDTSTLKTTIISEWDLVCDRSWLASTYFAVYQIGYGISGALCGYLSDKFGRLFTFKIWISLEILAAIAVIGSFSIYTFMIAQMVLGFSVFGRCLTGYLLLLECSGCSYRGLICVFYQIGLIIGYAILPGIAYLLQNFRHIEMVTVGLQIIFLIGVKWMPESPKWQLTNKKYKECEKNIKAAALQNNKEKIKEEEINKKIKVLIEFLKNESSGEDKNRRQSLLDLWREPKALKYCLILYFGLFANAFVYFGLSLNVGDLGGNLFLDSFFYALSELLANAVLYFALVKFGRRLLYVSFIFGAGLSCLGVAPLLFSDILVTYRIIVGMLGRFCVSCSFGIIYLQAAEIIPTTVRQIGVGSCALVGRIGSMSAPFVKELTDLTHPSVSMVLFGSVSIVNALLALFLPETKGVEIPDTIEEMHRK